MEAVENLRKTRQRSRFIKIIFKAASSHFEHARWHCPNNGFDPFHFVRSEMQPILRRKAVEFISSINLIKPQLPGRYRLQALRPLRINRRTHSDR